MVNSLLQNLQRYLTIIFFLNVIIRILYHKSRYLSLRILIITFRKNIMVKYRCKFCKREFSTSYGLTQHCNAKHRGRTTPSNEIVRQVTHHQQSQVLRPEHDANLWDTPITMALEPVSTIRVENPVSQV